MLTGKHVLITGAGGGIGRACAVMMAKEHAEVFITGRKEAPLQETKDIIEAAGGNCDYALCDVADEKAVERLGKTLKEKYGVLDVLVNNAAVFLPDNILSEELEKSWEIMMDVNVMGIIRMIHMALQMMTEQGGSIINLSSIDAFSGCMNYSGYSASKGAVISLTRALALELGKYEVRVNAVAPGITDTPMTHERIQAGKEKYLARLSLKRIGKDKEIAGAVLFLASELSSYVTGEVINVNGGMQFI